MEEFLDEIINRIKKNDFPRVLNKSEKKEYLKILKGYKKSYTYAKKNNFNINKNGKQIRKKTILFPTINKEITLNWVIDNIYSDENIVFGIVDSNMLKEFISIHDKSILNINEDSLLHAADMGKDRVLIIKNPQYEFLYYLLDSNENYYNLSINKGLECIPYFLINLNKSTKYLKNYLEYVTCTIYINMDEIIRYLNLQNILPEIESIKEPDDF